MATSKPLPCFHNFCILHMWVGFSHHFDLRLVSEKDFFFCIFRRPYGSNHGWPLWTSASCDATYRCASRSPEVFLKSWPLLRCICKPLQSLSLTHFHPVPCANIKGDSMQTSYLTVISWPSGALFCLTGGTTRR